MKKLVSLLLALALLVSMSSVAFAAKEDFDPELVAAAQAEGELTVYGSCEEPYLAAAAKNFEKEFGKGILPAPVHRRSAGQNHRGKGQPLR